MDLRKKEAQNAVLGRIWLGVYHFVHMSPPGRTFSRGRIPPLRTDLEPLGKPWLSDPRHLEAVTEDNLLLEFAGRVAEGCLSAGVFFSWEIPILSFVMSTDLVKALLRRTDLYLIRLDQCRYGSLWRKGTFFLTNCSWWSGLSLCCHCAGGHRASVTVRKSREPWGQTSSFFPPQLADSLAKQVCLEVDWERAEVLRAEILPDIIGDAGETKRRGRKIPVPTCSHRWGKVSRWRRVALTRWGRKEHINILEARAWLLGVRHCSRSPGRRGLRVLYLVDSLVVLGAVGKGRSSCFALNQILRRAASHSLLWGTKVMMRWIPTWMNPADGPSRGGRIGVIPSSKFQKRRKNLGLAS
jgi:hypothetical protein